MTVSSTTTITGPLARTGASGEGPYVFTFDIFDETELEVWLRTTNDVLVERFITTNYTVNLTAKSITMTAGSELEVGEEITIKRKVPFTQEVDPTNQGPWFPDQHEEVWDRAIMSIQQLGETVDRCLKVGIGSIYDPDAITIDFWVNRPRLVFDLEQSNKLSATATFGSSTTEDLHLSYDEVEVEFGIGHDRANPLKDVFYMELSFDGGSTWETGSDYWYSRSGYSGEMAAQIGVSPGAGQTAIELCEAGQNVEEGINLFGRIKFTAIAGVSGFNLPFYGNMMLWENVITSANISNMQIGGAFVGLAVPTLPNGVRFRAGTGNTYGQVRMWGNPRT